MEINLRNYAHLGDAVWELFIREKTIFQTKDTNNLHKITTDKVKASFQQSMMLKIESFLTEDEKDIVRRARNLPVPTSRRSSQAEYRAATSFEAIIGWWKINDEKRLKDFFKFIEEIL